MNSKHYRIDYDRPLGNGSTGALYKGLFTKYPAVIRRLPKTEANELLVSKIEDAIQRLRVGSGLNAVVPCYFVDTTDDEFVLVTAQWGEDLSKIIDDRKLPKPRRLEIIGKVCEAVRSLHSKEIVHGKIKPSNMLCVNDGGYTVKLSDYGISNVMQDVVNMWMAPEQIHAIDAKDTTFEATFAADIFSLATVMFYIYTNGKCLFGNKYSSQLHRVRNNEPLSNLGKFVDPTFEKLIRAMTHTDPRKRPNINEVITHLEFLSYDFVFDFLTEVYKYSSKRFQIEKEINRSFGYKRGRGWNRDLNREWNRYLNDTSSKKSYKYEQAFHLLGLIRDKYYHSDELPKELVPIDKASYMRYFVETFPDLVSTIAAIPCILNLSLPQHIKNALTSSQFIFNTKKR